MSDNRLQLFKYQTLGNSYLIFDPNRTRIAAPALTPERDVALGALARILCDKAWGIGAFGMLYGPEPFQDEPLAFRIINSDGSLSGFSGNGARIFVRYLLDTGYVSAGSAFHIAAIERDGAGAPVVNRIPTAVTEHGSTITITAPQVPAFGPDAVDANIGAIRQGSMADMRLSSRVPAIAQIGRDIVGSDEAWADSTLVFIGNPHCVTFVHSPAHLPTFEALHGAGALRVVAFRPERGNEAQAVFGSGCNLQWAHVDSRTRIQLMIYERGEGPTLASGSSSIAAAAAAFARGVVDNILEVITPGGRLHIEILGSPEQIRGVRLIGTANRIGEMRVDEAVLQVEAC